ncbi:MAG: iron ABC transporter permease [Deltaproteobacteria bacterium]|nr:iron ABC transporter permease [Deltaproteobacteria bacterium]
MSLRQWAFLPRIRGNFLSVLAVGLTAWLIIVPLVLLISFSFRLGTPWQPGSFTLENYLVAYSDPQVYTMFLNTAILAMTSTLLSVGIAVLFAFLTERTDMPFRNVAWGLMLIPMAVPGILFAISWTLLLSPKIGLFNVWLRWLVSLFGAELSDGPLNIYSLWGMVFLEGLRGVTTIFLMVVGAFRAMDPSLEEASRVAGASNRATFFRIFIPLLTPALFAAGMYNFMTHLESLEIPLVIGFQAGIYVFPTYIYFTAQRFAPPRYGLSAALGAIFLVVSILLVYWYRRLIGQGERYTTVTGKGYRPRIVSLGKWRYLALALFLIYFILTIAAPTFILLWRSLLRFYVMPSWSALPRLTLENYWDALGEERVLEAAFNTIIVGLATAFLTMSLSLITAWVGARGRFRGRVLLDALTFLPHAIPGVIIGIALVILYLQPPLNYLPLYGTIWVIVMGLTASYIAFGSRTMNGAVAQIHQELEEAAQVAGAQGTTVLRTIVLPLLLPAFVGGCIWVASHSLRSFSIPLMLTTSESWVLSVVMWDLWTQGKIGQSCALGVVLILALAALTTTGRWLVSRLSRQETT